MADEEQPGVAVDETSAADAGAAPPDSGPPAEAAAAGPDLKQIIEVSVTDVGVLRKAVQISVPAEHVRSERDKQYAELLEDAIVPGFRKGRAPRRLVEKRFGGEVGDHVLTKLVPTAYLAALEKENLKALGDPLVRVKLRQKQNRSDEAATAEEKEALLEITDAMEHMRLPDDGPLTFTCEVEVRPTFELPALERIPIKRPVVSITEEDVSQQIKRLLSLEGTFVPVADGVVELHDLLVADVTMKVGDEVVKHADNEPVFARGQQIEGIVLDKLGDVLVGGRVGDVRRITATVPADHADEKLRGKEAVFEIKLNEIKRLRLPELNEAYLKNRGYDSEQELRADVRRQMESRLDETLAEAMRGQVCQYLLEHTRVEVPEGLSARQVARAVVRKVIELRRQGWPDAEIAKHADELRTSALAEAIETIKLQFILEAIAESREISVTEEELNTDIARIASRRNQRFDRARDQLARDGGLENLVAQIRHEKCLDQLIALADITETPGPPSPSAPLAEAT